MRIVVRQLKEQGTSDGKYDALAGLTQLDRDRNLLERDALMLIGRMFDDVEDFDALRNSLRDIMNEDVVLGTRIMKIFDVLIQGLIREQRTLASVGFLP